MVYSAKRLYILEQKSYIAPIIFDTTLRKHGADTEQTRSYTEEVL